MGSERVWSSPWNVVERDWDSGAGAGAGAVVVVVGANDDVGAGPKRPSAWAGAAGVGEAEAGPSDMVEGNPAGRGEGDEWGVVDVKRVLRRKITLRRTVMEGSNHQSVRFFAWVLKINQP